MKRLLLPLLLLFIPVAHADSITENFGSFCTLPGLHCTENVEWQLHTSVPQPPGAGAPFADMDWIIQPSSFVPDSRGYQETLAPCLTWSCVSAELGLNPTDDFVLFNEEFEQAYLAAYDPFAGTAPANFQQVVFTDPPTDTPEPSTALLIAFSMPLLLLPKGAKYWCKSHPL